MSKKLTFYGGDGFGGQPENDPYQVIDGETKRLFGKFSEAKRFYDTLTGERFFWDLRRGELLDAWSFEDDDISRIAFQIISMNA